MTVYGLHFDGTNRVGAVLEDKVLIVMKCDKLPPGTEDLKIPSEKNPGLFLSFESADHAWVLIESLLEAHVALQQREEEESREQDETSGD